MTTRYLAIFLLIGLRLTAQHNSSYSQYIFNGLLLNPAYAGSSDALNLTSLYRKQWLGLNGAPTTITFSGHMPLKNKHINLGMIFVNDQFGVSEHNKINAVYAYRLKLLSGEFSIGLQAGIDAYKSNWDLVRTTQLRDPSFSTRAERSILPQAGMGAYYYNPKLYLGVSIPALIGNNFNKYQTAIFNAGYVFSASDNFKIKPALLVKYVIHSPLDVNLTSTFYWKTLMGIGLGYSINGTAMAYLDLKVNDQFRLGYAYDYTFSRLKNYSSGSHEIMLRYLFQYKVKVSSARYF